MDAETLKYIAIGLMAFAMAGSAVGVANVFASLMNSAARNPSMEGKLFKHAMIGAGMSEAMGIFGLGVALLILFK